MERLLSRRCLGKECADRRERTGESGGEVVRRRNGRSVRGRQKRRRKEEANRRREREEPKGIRAGSIVGGGRSGQEGGRYGDRRRQA